MDGATGTLKEPRPSKASKPAPGINGAIKSPLNGHAVGRKKNMAEISGPGILSRTVSIVARLLTWYSILTILLRCPATLDACDETSPRICKPYFKLKHAVAPHLEPYYDTYAAPYIDLVRPYYNTVDRVIVTPSWSYAKQHGAPRLHQAQAFGIAHWEKSVQPQITKAQELAKARYAQSLAPHINRVSAAVAPFYDIARTNTLQTYHELLLPTYQYIQPHVREGYRVTSAVISNTVVPSFIWGWNKTYVFLDATVWPQFRAMYMENVEPQLVKIGKRLGRYSSGKKSVPKPLADTSPSSSTKSTSSFTKPALSAPTTSPTLSPSSAPSSATVAHTEGVRTAADSARTRSTIEPIPPPEVDERLESADPVRRTAREIVAADLKDWQERYAKAADEGAAEIDDRVQEIAKKMLRRNARITGKSLLEKLQAAAVSELVALRRVILDVVGDVNKGSTTPEQGQEQLIRAIRQAGMAVKAKAQDVRTWRENYEAEMQAAITKAAETHFTILENIRDLALQKIGMKWAWMDGVTYKDWAKYHLLKSRFDEWKGDLENHIVTHPSLEAAQIEAANIEDEAMKVAASTAKELGRLKQVANWKLIAGDDTPEFDSTLMQQAAEAVEAAQLAAETAERSASGVPDAVTAQTDEGISQGAEDIEDGTHSFAGPGDATQDLPSALAESETTSSQTSLPPINQGAEKTDSSNVETTSSASEELSSVVERTSDATPDHESMAPEFNESSADEDLVTPKVASTVIFGEPAIVSNATEVVEDVPGAAQLPHLQGAELDERDSVESVTTEPTVADATSSVKPAFLGAAAQSVPSRRPILDDDTFDDVSSAMESMRDDLKSAYSVAMSRANDQYSQALSIVSAQIRGTPKPAHEQMLASVTSAYSKAMASASSRLDDALRAASSQLQGTTTTRSILPTTLPIPDVPDVGWSRVESIAAERLQQGVAWAEEQYESAKIAVGLATPTPSTPAEHVSKLLDNARHNYYAGLGVAHARYSEFLAAASSAFSSMTASPTPTDLAGSASSVASVASGSAASVASVVSEGASSVMSAASASASRAASVAGENISAAAAAGYDAASAAGDRVGDGWEAVITKISIQVYGAPTPTPWYSSIYSAATDYASSATSAAGDGAASASSAANLYAVAGSQEVARQYSAASSIISELVVGREPAFSESVFSRLSAAYETGASSASRFAGAAQATAASAVNQAGEVVNSVGSKVASAASEATEAVNDKVSHARDEL
ncbi:Transcription factor hoxa13 [Madurella fahalii]|uniref:Transcription factor hoxa13 n=1 Tax=Madurella fahalii TaxID=1157608 RepID=A0ABQ0GQ41_9PEZI